MLKDSKRFEGKMVKGPSVQELHYPERLFARRSFDSSFLHSHTLWHLLVWLVQRRARLPFCCTPLSL